MTTPQTASQHERALPSLELILQSHALLAAARAREALECAEQALRLEPRNADALYLLGVAHYRCGELSQAEARLKQAVQTDASVALFHTTLGNVLQDRGALDEAVKAYRRAIRLKPDFCEPYNDLGTAYFAQGHPVRAIESYLRAAELRPDHAVAQANLGSIYRKLGLPREARSALQREFLLRLSGALRRLLRFRRPSLLERAEQFARHALTLQPRSAAVYSRLAEILLKQGRMQEAEQALREATAIDRHHLAAWTRLGDLLRLGGR